MSLFPLELARKDILKDPTELELKKKKTTGKGRWLW